mmetsp:Transcript_15510/g.39260  ORF Transcript_15510/g.39260 Transcript_15510/m.39260 type:complete len:299 (+) Transcript_15510:176-1072(+)
MRRRDTGSDGLECTNRLPPRPADGELIPLARVHRDLVAGCQGLQAVTDAVALLGVAAWLGLGRGPAGGMRDALRPCLASVWHRLVHFRLPAHPTPSQLRHRPLIHRCHLMQASFRCRKPRLPVALAAARGHAEIHCRAGGAGPPAIGVQLGVTAGVGRHVVVDGYGALRLGTTSLALGGGRTGMDGAVGFLAAVAANIFQALLAEPSGPRPILVADLTPVLIPLIPVRKHVAPLHQLSAMPAKRDNLRLGQNRRLKGRVLLCLGGRCSGAPVARRWLWAENLRELGFDCCWGRGGAPA